MDVTKEEAIMVLDDADGVDEGVIVQDKGPVRGEEFGVASSSILVVTSSARAL